jgi:acylphosphatase
VEAVAQGPASLVLALIEWARRGPEQAHVAGVVVTEVVGDELLVGFEQRVTV